MHITIVALVCHTLGTIPAPVCREEIVVEGDMSMAACLVGQPAIADWKAHSIFRSEAWTVARIKCVPGDYVIKERV